MKFIGAHVSASGGAEAASVNASEMSTPSIISFRTA